MLRGARGGDCPLCINAGNSGYIPRLTRQHCSGQNLLQAWHKGIPYLKVHKKIKLIKLLNDKIMYKYHIQFSFTLKYFLVLLYNFFFKHPNQARIFHQQWAKKKPTHPSLQDVAKIISKCIALCAHTSGAIFSGHPMMNFHN